jgi:lipoate-protein ligase A
MIAIVDLDCTDVFHHLAMEEYLLDHVAEQEVLYLWRSAPAVVIGRNQNPWRELAEFALAEEGVTFARRLSGGGAVYHDLGNLNYTFVRQRDRYDVDSQTRVMVRALESLGIAARVGDRHELLVGAAKVSGTAFRIRRDSAFHHGTLLLHADLSALERCLHPPDLGILSKGVRSIPSPVINLCELRSDLDCASVAAAIAAAANCELRNAEVPSGLASRVERYRSWEWRFAQTPRFCMESKEGMMVTVERGRVVDLQPPGAIACGSIGDPFALSAFASGSG